MKKELKTSPSKILIAPNTPILTSGPNMVSKENAEAKISKSEADLQEQFNEKYENNSDNYADNDVKLRAKYNDRQADIDKLEEDRIGRGVTAETIGTITNAFTLGKAGSNIGRPREEKPMPEFEPIMKYHGSDTMISSLDEGAKVVRPPARDNFDPAEAQGIMDEFNDRNEVANNNAQIVSSKNNKKD